VLVSNHVLAGAAIGALARRRPALAFVAGLASHLLLDGCPHWGMPLDTDEDYRAFLRVARCDGCCGLALMGAAAATAGRGSRTAVLAAMTGSVLLDLDKPVRHFFGIEVFPAPLQRFHENIQKRVESRDRMPQEFVVGALGAVLALALLRTRT